MTNFVDIKKVKRLSTGEFYLNAVAEDSTTFPLYVGSDSTIDEALAAFKKLGKAKALKGITLQETQYGKQAVYNLDYEEAEIAW